MKTDSVRAVQEPRFAELLPDRTVPTAADECVHVARETDIPQGLRAHGHRPHRERAKALSKIGSPTAYVASASREGWNWDMTYLPAQVAGRSYFAHLTLNAFTRKVEGIKVDEADCDHAARLGYGVNSMQVKRYDRTMIGLHWLIALLIACGFYLGWIMTDIPGFTPAKLRYFSWHKWIGVTVFALALFRIAWRISHRLPQRTIRDMDWQDKVAGLVHLSLYGLMLAIPISGYLYSSAAGIQVVYLGLFPLPTIIEPNQALKGALRTGHLILNYGLLSLVSIHILAALKHQFIDRDGVLVRMAPFIK